MASNEIGPKSMTDGSPHKQHDAHNEEEHNHKEEMQFTKQRDCLRRLLNCYFDEALIFKNCKNCKCNCRYHILHLVFLLLHVVNIGMITTQLLSFGNDRTSFSNEVNRGHLALAHLLVKDWDASWEGPLYPSSRGDFAVYTIEELVSGINYAVERYYNVESKSIGFYVRLPQDEMKIKFKYFEFPGFSENNNSSVLNIAERTIAVDKGLSRLNISETNGTTYTYDVLEELKQANITEPVKKMLSTSLLFQMHSVRVLAKVQKARCLRINGEVLFSDLDNNGQVLVELETFTTRIRCSETNLLIIPEPVLEHTREAIIITIIVFSGLTMIAALYKIIFGIVIACKTHTFMEEHYQTVYKADSTSETNLPCTEYISIFQIWDILVIIADSLNIYGSVSIMGLESQEYLLSTIDSYTICLGFGCLFSWITILRFVKFHFMFNVLFKTMYSAFGNVVAFLICVSFIFVGFWMTGYVVFGPYHSKFSTPARSFETLFSVAKGNNIFETLAMEESNANSGEWVLWFTRFYAIFFVAVFSIVVINLLVAIFISAYNTIVKYENEDKSALEHSPIEKALLELIYSKTEDVGKLRESIYKMMHADKDKCIPVIPRTLNAFMEAMPGKSKNDSGSISGDNRINTVPNVTSKEAIAQSKSESLSSNVNVINEISESESECISGDKKSANDENTKKSSNAPTDTKF